MTRLRWTEPASADFLGIVEWLKARNPAAAARVGRRILDDAEQLANFPYLGKPGRSPDTRELVVTRFPYLIVYAVEHAAVASEQPQAVVDTAVGHLAGAMGRPAWVLLAHAPDWRWLCERADTPWYPSLRLFRQPAPRRWEPLLECVAAALASAF